MTGGDIYCGSFQGEDKSGSAYAGVLDALAARTEGEAKQTVLRLKEELAQSAEYVEIVKTRAAVIEPLLGGLKAALVEQIGHSDWQKAAKDEEAAGLDAQEGKLGKSKGWQLYCATNLQSACSTAISENESVFITFS